MSIAARAARSIPSSLPAPTARAARARAPPAPVMSPKLSDEPDKMTLDTDSPRAMHPRAIVSHVPRPLADGQPISSFVCIV
jgi:hypothetical protein